MAVTLAELARHIGAELHGGEPDQPLQRVATLDNAGPGDVAFLVDPRYRKFLKVTRASVVILAPDMLEECPVPALVTDNPYLGYARAVQFLLPAIAAPSGQHPTAVVSSEATVSDSAYIGPHCTVERGAEIGPGAFLGPACIIGEGSSVGGHSRLLARVTLGPGVSLGSRCLLHPGAVIGADGFGLAKDGERWVKIPQLGGVRIGDDVEIGANTTVDRGALKDTVIEDGVKLDNQIQVGHNCRIGAHTAVAACTGISGSTVIGRRCTIGGGVGINGHISIADDVTITGMSMITRSINKAGVYSGGWPAEDNRSWTHSVARLRRLGQLLDRVKALEDKTA